MSRTHSARPDASRAGMVTRLAALAATSALALTGCGGPTTPPRTSAAGGSTTSATSSAPTTPATATSSPGSTPTTASPTTAGRLTGVPVYWVAESQRSFRLYREFRTVTDAGGVIASAVAAMTRMAPLDPDYSTPWRPATRVAVTRSGRSLTVDLSADAIANTQVGSELAATAVQQLVYTATAAAATAGTPVTTVTITIDGSPADAWGVVRLGEPTPRAPLVDVQAHAWVTAPQQGATVPAGLVTFTGYGTSFEATFGWVVRTAAGAVVARGSAMGGDGTGGFGELTFSARLTPGSYVVQLSTDDPSGGADGRGPATDTKAFTVS